MRFRGRTRAWETAELTLEPGSAHVLSGPRGTLESAHGERADAAHRIETTKNIYGHLFAHDRAFILEAMNRAVSCLYVEDDSAERAA